MFWHVGVQYVVGTGIGQNPTEVGLTPHCSPLSPGINQAAFLVLTDSYSPRTALTSNASTGG